MNTQTFLQLTAASVAGFATSFAFPGAGHATDYRLDWFTFDSGGSTCHGGTFTLEGTIGQADAGLLHGGNFKLEGGFWHGVSIVQVPGGPVLKIQLLGAGQALLSWPIQVSGFTLEQCGSLGTSWSPVVLPVLDTATEHTVAVPISGPMKCYRLKQSQP